MVPVRVELAGLPGAGELQTRRAVRRNRRGRSRGRAQLLRLVLMVTHSVIRVHHVRQTHGLHSAVRVIGRGGQSFNGTHVAVSHLARGVSHRRRRLRERPAVVHEARLDVLRSRDVAAVAIPAEERLARLEVSHRRSEGALHAPPAPVVSLLEHVLAGRVQGPIVALALPAALPGNFNEAFVQTQVVSNAVLPALLVFLVERKLCDDVLVNTGQGQSLLRTLSDSHGDQSHIRVRRLLGRVHFLRILLLHRLVFGKFFFLHRVGVVDHQSHCVII